ncbi:hypothetical protein BV25DRAFT_1408204 [Artomyces pyxidatus]|uniref:Uncharacterized protein n=1 Tax=Artomyces pyxidatus TaxID=48021 RepID=A0ACB8TDY1_9AGAM|nr:hypothetical protein BV25DRAFT_1408204 [Artomyces pyxidatus]
MSASNYTTDPNVPKTAIVIGPVFVGNAVNWLLMGTLIVQVYMFYVKFPGERLGIRLLVYGIFCLDIVQTVLGTQLAWYWMIINWNNPASLEDTFNWPSTTIPIMCALVSGIVQMFYAWQIWVLSTGVIMHFIAVLIVVIAFGQSLAGIIASSLLLISPTAETFVRLHPGFEFWLARSLVTDILICGCMLWILYHAKKGTMWAESETLISKLIVNTIRTGTVTVVCAAIELALFVAGEDHFNYLAPAYILGKLCVSRF